MLAVVPHLVSAFVVVLAQRKRRPMAEPLCGDCKEAGRVEPPLYQAAGTGRHGRGQQHPMSVRAVPSKAVRRVVRAQATASGHDRARRLAHR
jgi:hypothetical protein